MFGKLMNYELRYLMRVFAPMWCVILILCTISRLLIPFSDDAMTFMEGNRAIAAFIFGMLSSIALLMSVMVMTVVLVQRYYKGMFGDEGYLLFTLPVTTWQMIHAKGLSALLMVIVTEAVTVMGVLIASSHSFIWQMLQGVFGSMMYYNDYSSAGVAIQCFWIISAFISALAESIYLVYLVITMGQMWKKHPVLGAIGAFYAIELVQGSVVYGLSALLGRHGDGLWSYALWMMESGDGIQMLTGIALLIVKSLLLVLIYSFGAKVFLEKRLELQ